jgi:nucleotide-binding universal stress UspA family protein
MAYSLPSPREFDKQAKAVATKLLDRAAAIAKKSGVQCGTMSAQGETPWEAILAAAKKAKADTIVMASHGRRGLASLLLGSETTKVLTHSKVPVLVVR